MNVNLDNFDVNKISCIQRAFRCYLSRKYTLSPGDLKPFLSFQPYLVCEEANRFLREGKTLTRRVESLPNITYHLRWDKAAGELWLVFPESAQTMSGGNKVITPSNTLYVPLTAGKREVAAGQSVLIRASTLVEEGNEIHRRIYQAWLKEKPEGVYIMEPFEKLEEGLYTQPRLETDLYRLFKNGESPKLMAEYLRDMTRTLAWIHKQGYIHADVTMGNFLMEWNESVQRKVPYIFDFDYADLPGAPLEKFKEDYCHWDPAMSEGNIFSPYTDYYGLTVAHLRLQFPGLDDKEIKEMRNAVFNNVNLPNAAYWKKDPFANEIQKEVWDLFIDICKDSTKLYRQLHIAYTLSQGQLGRWVDRIKTFDVAKRSLELANKLVMHYN